MMKTVLAALALIAVTGPQTALADAAADARPTIEHANTAWESCIKTSDPDCPVADYAEDGVFILKDGKTVTGKAEIAELYKARGKSGSTITEAKIHSDAIVTVAEDLVYEYGSGTMQVTAADGSQSVRGGPYLTVWKRGADGTWRIIRNLVF